MCPAVLDSIKVIASVEALRPLAVTVPFTIKFDPLHDPRVTAPFTLETSSELGLVSLWETGVE